SCAGGYPNNFQLKRSGKQSRQGAICVGGKSMRRSTRFMIGALVLGAVVAGGSGTASAAVSAVKSTAEKVELNLTPSNGQLAACMPTARLNVVVNLTEAKKGFDVFEIRARDLPPNRPFTVFLLQMAGSPFGAAEYIGDFTTNKAGNATNTFKLIVEEAFSST